MSSFHLFPDWGARRDRAGMLGLFDPSNLELYLDADLGADEERALIRDCKIDEAAAIARTKTAAMTSTQRFDYALKVTSELHELRHVHDYFGTTWGYERFLRTVGDVVNFHKMWSALDGVSTIELPLTSWGAKKGAPAALLEYLDQRAEFVTWAKAQQGEIQSIPWSAGSSADIVIAVDAGPNQFALPTVEINFRNARTQEMTRKFVALGADPVMEGSAVVVQRRAMAHIFGNDVAAKLMGSLIAGPENDDTWIYYIAVDRYLTKQLGKFWVRYHTALSDLALMASYDEAPDRRHPGIRLSLATRAAAGLGPEFHTDPSRDLVEYQEMISERCGWPSPRTVVEKRVAVLRAQLAELDEKASRVGPNVGLWDRLIRAADRAHLISLEQRLRVPDLFANPDTYLQAACILPPPPVSVERGRTVFRGIGPGDTGKENGAAFRQWYLLEYLVNRLLFTTTLPCPIAREPHDCPGDPLSKGWTPIDTCPFSRMVVDLGIPNKRFKLI